MKLFTVSQVVLFHLVSLSLAASLNPEDSELVKRQCQTDSESGPGGTEYISINCGPGDTTTTVMSTSTAAVSQSTSKGDTVTNNNNNEGSGDHTNNNNNHNEGESGAKIVNNNNNGVSSSKTTKAATLITTTLSAVLIKGPTPVIVNNNNNNGGKESKASAVVIVNNNNHAHINAKSTPSTSAHKTTSSSVAHSSTKTAFSTVVITKTCSTKGCEKVAEPTIINNNNNNGGAVLVLSGGESDLKKNFAWTTISYATTSLNVPKARGLCPGLKDSPKPALIVSRVAADGDKEWLERLNDKYHLCVYTADAEANVRSTALQVPKNRGHEAMGYLTFLIDNYQDIPAAGAIFVHGSRWAWHNDDPDYDNAALLRALNVSAALEPYGYHNMRCDWSASTCSPASAPPQGSLETSLNARLQPWDLRVVSDAALPGAFASIFGGTAFGSHATHKNHQKLMMGTADALRAQCCAQFAVAQDRIWQHSRDEYVALRQWLLDDGAAPQDDRIAGRIISYIWHVLFMLEGRLNDLYGSSREDGGVDLDHLNSQACPRASECYCRLYGRCNLNECTLGHCNGQYSVPPDYKLP